MSPVTVIELLSRWPDRCTAADRLRWLRVLVALASLVGLILSARLWLSARWYPLTPVSGALPAIPPPIDLWLFLLLLLLAAVVVVSSSRWGLLLFVGLVGLLCLWDQSRWQPWVYQYAFMLAAFTFAPRPGSRVTPAPVALATCRLIVVSLYVWSGLQKLNASFALEIVPYLSGPLLARSVLSITWVSRAFALSIALFESGLGIGLLTRRYRHGSVLAAVIMHLAIIAALGPWGRDWNRVVLPWNLAMVGIVSILFWRIGDVTAREILWPARAIRSGGAAGAGGGGARRRQRHSPAGAAVLPAKVRGALGFHVIIVILFGLMPLLSLVDAWDSYLSWSLYSGNTRRADVVIAEGATAAMPPEIRRYIEPAIPDWYVLAFESWSMGELNVPPYPEARIFLNVARGLCVYAGNPAGVWLRMSEKPDRLTGARQTKTYRCSELIARR